MGLLERAKKQGGRYLNPVPTALGGFGLVFKVLPMYLKNKAEREPKLPLGPFRTDVRVYRQAPVSGLRVTWFGHSSMLLEIDGLRILVDPIWEERASPAQWFGPQRFFAPTMPLEQMPELDAVLISHDHYDHLGALTVGRLARMNVTARAVWVTSAGVGRVLRRFGVPEGRITELDWTQSTDVAGAELGKRRADYRVAGETLFGPHAVGQVHNPVELVRNRRAEAPGVLRGGLGVVGGVCGDRGAVPRI